MYLPFVSHLHWNCNDLNTLMEIVIWQYLIWFLVIIVLTVLHSAAICHVNNVLRNIGGIFCRTSNIPLWHWTNIWGFFCMMYPLCLVKCNSTVLAAVLYSCSPSLWQWTRWLSSYEAQTLLTCMLIWSKLHNCCLCSTLIMHERSPFKERKIWIFLQCRPDLFINQSCSWRMVALFIPAKLPVLNSYKIATSAWFSRLN